MEFTVVPRELPQFGKSVTNIMRSADEVFRPWQTEVSDCMCSSGGECGEGCCCGGGCHRCSVELWAEAIEYFTGDPAYEGELSHGNIEEMRPPVFDALGLSGGQREWAADVMDRGCVGLVQMVLGTDGGMLGNCWSTIEGANKSANELVSKDPCCCPVIYGIQLSNGRGRDGVNPDASVDDKGKVNLDNWNRDKEGGGDKEKGHYFNFGVLLGEDQARVWFADQFHNPDKNRNGRGDNDPDSEIQAMNTFVKSISDFNALADPKNGDAVYDMGVWCVKCQGEWRQI